MRWLSRENLGIDVGVWDGQSGRYSLGGDQREMELASRSLDLPSSSLDLPSSTNIPK